MKTMLSFKFPGAIFFSILLLLITIPAISFNAADYGGLSQELIDSSSAPKTPLNKQATQFVKKYVKDNNECLDAVKQKSLLTFAMMDEVFTKYGLPIELKYLAVVESELNPKAVSRVGAVGPWQFMPATAKILGLKITRKYDERKNFKKSTKAAAIYLRDLYTQYGDWLLVLAAYNCGPKPVNTAIRRSGSRNFWKLQYHLPAESRAHVKKYIATHYYFEGKGSVTTLTKTENIKHAQAVSAWTANFEKTSNITPLAVTENNASDTTKTTVALK
ncbi:MAG: lytic transglycosylase domain-containing protein [Chitinophagaceae bacterium]|nr:lytic transglycosylase domain-containing protein [Chitinophagaceae bacterium]